MSRRCRSCGATVPPNSINCPACYKEMPREEPAPPRPKDPRAALVLALVPAALGLWGLGHLYMGITDRGLYYLGTGIALSAALLALAYGWFLVITIVCLVFVAIVWLGLFALQALEVWVITQGGQVPRRPPRRSN